MAILGADGMVIEDADARAGHQVALAVGANPITVAVTAVTDADGLVTTPYTVTVTRAASTDATLATLSLEGVTLDPAFDAATTAYSAECGE